MTTPFQLGGTLGVDVTKVDTTREFKLGTQLNFDDGSCYRYIEADAAIAQYAFVFVEEDWGASEANTTLSGVQPTKGLIPQVALASGEFGWALEEGPGLVLAAASAAADVKLYTTATDGVVDDAAADLIQGLRLTATNGGSQAATACFANTPMVTNAQD